MGQQAPGGTVRLRGRDWAGSESISSSDSLSEEDEVGESAGVELGE